VKLQLFGKNKIIIEVIAKPEWKWKLNENGIYLLLPLALLELINSYTRHLQSSYLFLMAVHSVFKSDLRFLFFISCLPFYCVPDV